MRQSVEHLGPQHEIRPIVVAEGVVMMVDPEFELRRFDFMKDLLTKYGRIFSKNHYDYRYPSFDLGGRCYDQAMQLTATFPVIYCEGIMLPKPKNGKVGLPMPHAWCVTLQGELLDPTAHKVQNHPELLYFGIPFKTTYCLDWHEKYGFHGMLDGHPELGDTVGVYADDLSLWLHPLSSKTI